MKMNFFYKKSYEIILFLFFCFLFCIKNALLKKLGKNISFQPGATKFNKFFIAPWLRMRSNFYLGSITSEALCRIEHLFKKDHFRFEKNIYRYQRQDGHILCNGVYIIARYKSISIPSYKMRADY